ncbi:MAG: metallophosphoesterase [Actinomycetia bacterium]|nr:metallophosphoesterase [Actinomycetes bacterium]
MPRAVRLAAAAAVAGAGAIAYGGLIERNAFTVRRFTAPVLEPGTPPLRVLHISDLHLMPNQRRKRAWLRSLAELAPDLVVNTGDTLAHPRALPTALRALEPLFAFPGAFVPGNNDYYGPKLKNPVRYFAHRRVRVRGARMPWPALAAALREAGWTDLTDRRVTLLVRSGRASASGGASVGVSEAQPARGDAVRVALAGTDDPHLHRARYELIAGRGEPAAAVRIGVTHSPEPAILGGFAADWYDLVLAGHTHGGQVRVPFGPAVVTNCGIDVWRARGLHRWDDRMWFHVCAGAGTSPYAPVRIACRPEAALLTLVPR